jgi:hypothetical protein
VPVLFRTRWALSYLRGPLTLTEIGKLTPAVQATATGASSVTAPAPRPPEAAATTPGPAASARPVVQHGVTERFVVVSDSEPPHYQPRLGARVRVHFVDARAGIDAWQDSYYLAPVSSAGPDWGGADIASGSSGPRLATEPAAGASFDEVPAALLSARDHKRWKSSLADHVYRNVVLELPACPALKMTAEPGMTGGEFRARVALAARERRDAAVEALRDKYGGKLASLEERARRAMQKVEREKAQATDSTVSTALAVGGSLLGALFGGGRRGSAISKARTAARSASRTSKERTDVALAEAEAQSIRDQIEALNAELETEVARLESEWDPAAIPVETRAVKPRKSDIAVEDLALVWVA